MPATRPRIVHAAVALSVLAALAAAPALATEVEDRNQTAETPSDAVEATVHERVDGVKASYTPSLSMT